MDSVTNKPLCFELVVKKTKDDDDRGYASYLAPGLSHNTCQFS